ncbi:MAG TPA: dihydroorotate dehydrogenase [Acidimicrobiia bacterium]
MSTVPAILETRVGPLTLPNPVVAASGTFGHGAELAALCDPTGLGAVTVKSIAAFAWPGNRGLRVTEAPGGGMLNSVGLAGPGIDAWIADDLPPLLARGARVVVSIWGRTVEEYAAAAAPLRTIVPASDAGAGRLLAVEVNLSCPNLEDRRRIFAHAPATTTAALLAVRDALGGALPVFAKLSPNVTDIREIAGAALEAGADGLTLVNTVLGLVVDAAGRRPKLGAGGGGLSGPPIRPVALRAVWDVSREFPGVAIIGTGGVSTGEHAVEMLLAGASAVGVGTATFAEPRATLRIVGEIAEWCRTHGVARVADLVGKLEEV